MAAMASNGGPSEDLDRKVNDGMLPQVAIRYKCYGVDFGFAAIRVSGAGMRLRASKTT